GIAVETQINNYPAVSFYRKHGFEISGFNDHLYSNDDLARQDVALFLFREAD
ncbi:MAG: GNAT family N-acetyltransferase, partial [Chloroflexi bacterium]|nr:GNAT family N-acetyltransferase [Chloroflexota bacterium]